MIYKCYVCGNVGVVDGGSECGRCAAPLMSDDKIEDERVMVGTSYCVLWFPIECSGRTSTHPKVYGPFQARDEARRWIDVARHSLEGGFRVCEVNSPAAWPVGVELPF